MAGGNRRRDQAAQALAAAPETASPALLRRTIDAARGEGPLDTDLARAQRALADAEHRATAATHRTAAVAWRPGEPRGLPIAPSGRGGRGRGAPSCRWATACQGTGGSRRPGDRDHRPGRGGVPAVAGRDRPDAGRRGCGPGGARSGLAGDSPHAGGRPAAADEDEDGLPAGHLPDIFEALRDQADQLADRRADEAQRVADFLSATDRLGVARRRRSAADAVLAAVEEVGRSSRGCLARTLGSERPGAVGAARDGGMVPSPGGGAPPWRGGCGSASAMRRPRGAAGPCPDRAGSAAARCTASGNPRRPAAPR